MQDVSFLMLIERVRAGDQDAAALLVERHTPAVRRAVRFRLTDPRLRSLFDSMDICQSAMGSFFIRAAAGFYEVNSPEQLVSLLTTMARNKLATHARRERARLAVPQSMDEDLSGVVSAEPDPARMAVAKELCQIALGLLTDEERHLLDLRQDGKSWDEIAQSKHSTPVAVRKQLSRALDRVLQATGIE